MKKYLITGGAGFVGSHLVEKLINEGAVVKILDNFSSGTLKNLIFVKNNAKIIKADIRDKKISKHFKDIDVVYHLAALVSVQKSIKDPSFTYNNNITGFTNIMEIVKENNIPKIIFASSSAVYGEINKNNIKESDKISPLSPYGFSKLESEKNLETFSKINALTAVSLRFFNIYGPRQDTMSPYSGVVSKFITCLLNNIRPEIYGDGNQTRDFIYVHDIISALRKAELLYDKKYQVFNVGTGNTITINNLYKLMSDQYKKITGENHVPNPVYKKARKGDIIYSGADITKIRTILKFIPQYTLVRGMYLYIKEFLGGNNEVQS